MPGYVYRVIPFEGRLKGSAAASEVSSQLQAAINSVAAEGWEFVTLADVGIEVSPGCIAGLLGGEKSYSRYDQLIFRRAG